jgi:hypothetical protein
MRDMPPDRRGIRRLQTLPGAALRRVPTMLAAGLLALVALAVVHFAMRPLGSGDLFWQVRAGGEILDTGALPGIDSFTYTIAGTPWNRHEWAFETVVALVQRHLGWVAFRAGVLILAGGAVAAAVVVASRDAGLAAAALAGVLAIVLGSYKFIPASQTLAMAMLLVLLAAFRGPATLARPGRFAALFALLVVGANFTAEALLFLPFLVLDQVAVRAGTGPGRRDLRRRLPLLLLLCVAPMVTPPQSSVLAYALAGSAANRGFNPEFAHLWEPAGTVVPFAKGLAAAVALAFVAYAVATLARAAGRWEALRRVGPGLLAVGAALVFERYLWMVAIPGVQMVVAATGAARRRAPALADAVAVAAAVAVLVPFAGAIAWSPALAVRSLADPGWWSADLDGADLPLECADALADIPAGSRVLTARPWAGYVEWRDPRLLAFVDGRNREFPWEVQQAAEDVLAGDARTSTVLTASRTDLVLARPGWDRLPGARESGFTPRCASANCALFGPRLAGDDGSGMPPRCRAAAP